MSAEVDNLVRLQHQDLQQLLREQAEELRRLRRWLPMDAQQRVMDYVLWKSGGTGRLPSPGSQQSMADALGLVRETVTRAVNLLQRAGLLTGERRMRSYTLLALTPMGLARARLALAGYTTEP